MASERRNRATLIWGLSAIAVGGLFLLDTAGYIHIGNLWRFWPLILIFLGLRGLIDPGNRSRSGGTFGSGIMLIWGILLLAANLGYVGWGNMWPWCLIGLGLLLIWEYLRPKPVALPLSGGVLNPESVFSSIEKVISDQQFKQGKASAVFGSVELDFTQANIEGDTAVLEVNAVFGSIEVRVPMNWKVSVEAGVMFGACENHTRAPVPNTPVKTLVVRGGAVFGSVEIRN
jgi:predicted membrane protein